MVQFINKIISPRNQSLPEKQNELTLERDKAI